MKAMTHVVLMAQGQIHGGTDQITVKDRKDKVMFANADLASAHTIQWTTKNPLKAPAKPTVSYGDPLTAEIADANTAPNGRYRYTVKASREAATGDAPGDGPGGGDVILNA